MTDKLSLVHPGDILLEEFIKPVGLSQNRLAMTLAWMHAGSMRLCWRRAVTADTALRLSRFFGNSPQFWMGLQSQYNLDIAVAPGEI